MPTYTVTDVSPNVRDWSSQQGGPMKEYRVHLNDGSQDHMNVEWSRKQSSPAPVKGQQIEGTLEDRGSHGLKLKVAPSFGGGGFARPEDPKRAARILRQHSQDMALRTIEVALQHGMYPEPPEDGAALLSAVKQLADWFDKDAEKAAQ